MKKIKSISILLFLAGWVLTSSISFMGCEPDDGDDDCDTCDLVRKPNIYLYPTETTFVQISLDFPMGGEVITSTPEYNAGWSVTVDPDGMIDNAFPYLFYESVQPDIWQKTSGWLVNKDDLGDFFKANLAIYGFSGREIERRLASRSSWLRAASPLK